MTKVEIRKQYFDNYADINKLVVNNPCIKDEINLLHITRDDFSLWKKEYLELNMNNLYDNISNLSGYEIYKSIVPFIELYDKNIRSVHEIIKLVEFIDVNDKWQQLFDRWNYSFLNEQLHFIGLFFTKKSTLHIYNQKDELNKYYSCDGKYIGILPYLISNQYYKEYYTLLHYFINGINNYYDKERILFDLKDFLIYFIDRNSLKKYF